MNRGARVILGETEWKKSLHARLATEYTCMRNCHRPHAKGVGVVSCLDWAVETSNRARASMKLLINLLSLSLWVESFKEMSVLFSWWARFVLHWPLSKYLKTGRTIFTFKGNNCSGLFVFSYWKCHRNVCSAVTWWCFADFCSAFFLLKEQ